MRTRYRIRLGSVYLDSLLDEEIQDALWILDISYGAPEIGRTVDAPGDRHGGIITRSYRQKATVTVTFGLYLYDTATRNTALQTIKTWAATGGTLRTNDRSGQALYNVVCEQFPEIESAKNWTDTLTMTFSAYEFPYWQNTTQTTSTLSGTSTSGTIDVPGNAEYARPTVSVTTNAAISWFEITTGSTKIRIEASIASGHTIAFSYDANGNLTIKDGSTSLLNKRTASSADELRVTPGAANIIQIKASAKITAAFSTRGAWL